MKVYFLDTSAYIKRYVKETGSPEIDRLFGEYATRHVSSLGLLECLSNLQRLRTVDRLITGDQLRILQAEVALDIESEKVSLAYATPVDINAAAQLLTQQYLTAVDALHIVMAKSLGSEVAFVSSDVKLNRVAAEQGLVIINPAADRKA